MNTAAPGRLSIVIKTYNEEAKIARAIDSALAAADELVPLRVEVVVADSCSSDRTVEVASRPAVRVVRLAHAQQRGCGIGVQLGYAATAGEWIYLMDGDMALEPGFLPAALAELQSDAGLAGVGGAVHDEHIGNAFDRIRVNNRSATRVGEVRWLVGGGLYRRAAIDAAGGYAADRNLKGYEEAELGLRLHAAGFRLKRLERRAVRHLGHDMSTWALLRRHWRSRRAMSAGVLLRSSFARPWFGAALRINLHPLATLAWWLLLFAVSAFAAPSWRALGWSAWAAASLLGVVALAAMKRDLRHALASVVSWHYTAAAMLIGLFTRQEDPRKPVDFVVCHDGAGR
jgi:glycosyltransferase involved in cell wall biosynthesis